MVKSRRRFGRGGISSGLWAVGLAALLAQPGWAAVSGGGPASLPDVNAAEDGELVSGDLRLYRAAAAGDFDTVRDLLEAGGNPVWFDPTTGDTPLHAAAFYGYPRIVGLLLDHGVPIELANAETRRTPLQRAYDGDRADVYRLLLKRGASEQPLHVTYTPLHWVAMRGKLNLLEMMLGGWRDPNKPAHMNYRPIHLAAKENKPGAIKMLAEHGADVNIAGWHGRTPLHEAAQAGALEAAKALIECKALVEARDGYGATPLMNARANEAMLKLLLEAGADPRVTPFSGRSMLEDRDLRKVKPLLESYAQKLEANPLPPGTLHEAAAEADAEGVAALIEAGAIVNQPDHYGRTPLHFAMSPAVAQLLLLQGADVNARDASGATPLILHARFDSHVEVVKTLIEHGADLNVKTKDGSHALGNATMTGSIETMRLLLEAGADVNLKGISGQTALFEPTFRDEADKIRLLVKHGADLEIRDDEGCTALFAAANYPNWMAKQQGKVNVLKALIEAGADIHAKNNKGQTPIEVASQSSSPDHASVLVEAGAPADIFVVSMVGAPDAARKLLEQDRSLVNQRGEYERTPLHLAVMNSQIIVFDVLLEFGADIEARDKMDRTPLLTATWKGDGEVTKALVERGGNINATDHKGNTALHLAPHTTWRGRRLVPLLIELGADPDIQNEDGDTALHDAIGRDNEKITKLLLDAGADPNIENKKGVSPLEMATDKWGSKSWKVFVDTGLINADRTIGSK